MRIRQVRPEFFTDSLTANFSAQTQIAYIGLWCAADDAGWLVWDVLQLGALIFPYKSVQVRTRILDVARADLEGSERLVVLDDSCAYLPTFPNHQRIGGNKTTAARDNHQKHLSKRRLDAHSSVSTDDPGQVRTFPDKSDRNGKVSNVTVGNGTSASAAVSDQRRGPSFKERVAAAGYDPEGGAS